MPARNGALSNSYFGTEEYIPPEALSFGPSSSPRFENDLWSLGVIIWQIFNSANETPFKGASQEETFKRIKEYDLDLTDNAFGHSVPDVAKDLIGKLVQKAPEKRLGAIDLEELKRHPFFEGIDFNTLYSTESPLEAKFRKLTL